MSITPTTEVQMYDCNNEIVVVKLITLMAWSIALKSETKGLYVSAQPVAPIVRKFLSTPDDYPIEELSDHITSSYNEVKEQMGIE